MSANDYRVVTKWRLRAAPWEVAQILEEPTAWPTWWPAAFLEVVELDRPVRTAIGRRVIVHTKGWLPHTFRLQATLTQYQDRQHCILRVFGDFEGQCECWLRAIGEQVEITFDWQPRVQKPFVRTLSWVAKPLFIANHKWVMRCGQAGLDLEVRRRRALRQRLPVPTEPPLPPTFPYRPRDRWARALGTFLQTTYYRLARPSQR